MQNKSIRQFMPVDIEGTMLGWSEFIQDWASRISMLKTYPEWQSLKDIIPGQYHSQCPSNEIERQWIDRVWNEMNMDAHMDDKDRLIHFYNHPIWIVAGIFSECYERWVQGQFHHCDVIRLIRQERLDIFESGAGHGALARMCLRMYPERINSYDIVEPYVNPMALELSQPYKQLMYLKSLPEGKRYDLIFSIAVIEHVIDPYNYLKMLRNVLKIGGYLYITTDFYPTICCHLRKNFFWRYCWEKVVFAMGFERVHHWGDGHCVFRKVGEQFDETKIAGIIKRAEQLFWAFQLRKYLYTCLRKLASPLK